MQYLCGWRVRLDGRRRRSCARHHCGTCCDHVSRSCRRARDGRGLIASHGRAVRPCACRVALCRTCRCVARGMRGRPRGCKLNTARAVECVHGPAPVFCARYRTPCGIKHATTPRRFFEGEQVARWAPFQALLSACSYSAGRRKLNPANLHARVQAADVGPLVTKPNESKQSRASRTRRR